MKTIEDFDELINPRTLSHHFLGPEPSPFVQHAIAREEKGKFPVLAHFFLRCFGTNVSSTMFVAMMMTKFNQEMYARLRARKNELLSIIGQKRPRMTKEVIETTVSTPVDSKPKTACPAISIEVITPHPKRTRGSDKGKSKADSSI